MPIYEFECKKCGKVTAFIEKVDEIRFWFRKCQHCGSYKLKRIMSAFTPNPQESLNEMLNDMDRKGQIKFVPQTQKPIGPPPGGCPYAQNDSTNDDTNTPTATN
jgi:putative FmdB family regulatory protein